MLRFIALDIETTGVDPRRDRIVELHLREVTWPLLYPKWAFSVLLNPGIPIPEEAAKVHGFTDQDVALCPMFHSIAARVQSLLRGAVIIAYNGRRFDVPLLHHELRRAGCPGLPVDQPIIDPYEIFVQDHPRSLTGALRHYAGEEHDGAHGAEADVDAMIKVLGAQLLKHPAPDVLQRALHPDKKPVALGGVFYEDADGIIRFGFGQHRDRPIACHPEYLAWMLRQDFDATAKNIARTTLNRGAAAA